MNILCLVFLVLFSHFAIAKDSANSEMPAKSSRKQVISAPVVSLDDKDFTPCLKALNEETVVWKDKVIPLDPMGHTFLIKADNNTMHVIGTKAAYILSDKPDCTTRIDPDPLAKIQQLYNAVAAKDAKSKKVVIDKCKYLPLAFQSENATTTPSVAQ